MSIFKGQLGDAGFVQLAQTFCDHPVVLLFGHARQRKIKTEISREIERDAAVFRRVGRRKKATVFAVLHVRIGAANFGMSSGTAVKFTIAVVPNVLASAKPSLIDAT